MKESMMYEKRENEKNKNSNKWNKIMGMKRDKRMREEKRERERVRKYVRERE